LKLEKLGDESKMLQGMQVMSVPLTLEPYIRHRYSVVSFVITASSQAERNALEEQNTQLRDQIVTVAREMSQRQHTLQACSTGCCVFVGGFIG
jgi:hypothetical protein